MVDSTVSTALFSGSTEIPYNEFKKRLANGQLVNATIGFRGIVGEMKNPTPNGSPPTVPFNTVPAQAGDPKLIDELQNANIPYPFEPPPNPLGGILIDLLPMILLGGFWYAAYRRSGGAAGGIFGVGRSKAIAVKPEDVTVNYKGLTSTFAHQRSPSSLAHARRLLRTARRA